MVIYIRTYFYIFHQYVLAYYLSDYKRTIINPGAYYDLPNLSQNSTKFIPLVGDRFSC